MGTAADADGVVTGAAAFTDPASRTLTYSTTGISNGGGTVTVDSGTGTYIYTPTQTQRQNATGSTTDTFTLTASNGVRTTDQTVTVTVSAGTPVAGGYSVLGGAPETGAVAGAAAFTDPAGRTLTYSTTGISTDGGTVSVDSATGTYTFTPTQAQRQAATGSTTDTFTITASNGVNSTNQTVTVSVDPGTPVAGTPTVGAPNTTPTIGNFTTFGTPFSTGSVNGVYASGGTVYAANSSRGLNISTNGGDMWGSTRNRQGVPTGLGSNVVNGVFAVGLNSTTVYAATRGGLSISTNGGSTFTNYLGATWVNGVFAVTGQDSTTVYAATFNGLSISTNGGSTFTTKTISDGLGSDTVNGVYSVGSGSTATVYAATSGGLSISTNGGSTWTNKPGGLGLLGSDTVNGVFAVTGQDKTTIYAATAGGLSISTNGGRTWTNKTIDNGLGSNIVNGVFASGTTVYAATAAGLSISTNGGATFTTYMSSSKVKQVYVDGNTVYAALTVGSTEYGLAKATVTNGTGVVTGSAAFTDPAGRALTYATTTRLSTGGGTVSVNAATGAFTFTPAVAQRTPWSTIDRFTITASNGVNSTDQEVTVTVAAAL